MDIELVPVITLLAGIVLLYAAITNRRPLSVVKLALTNGDLASAPPIGTNEAKANGTIRGQLVPPGAGEALPNARPSSAPNTQAPATPVYRRPINLGNSA